MHMVKIIEYICAYNKRPRKYLRARGPRGCNDLFPSKMSTESEVPPPEPPDGQTKPVADTTYKILIIGDSNVGKTSLLNRYCEGSFQNALIATVGECIFLRSRWLLRY